MLPQKSKVELALGSWQQGSFPAGTPGNGVPKVILTVVTAFPGTPLNQANQH